MNALSTHDKLVLSNVSRRGLLKGIAATGGLVLAAQLPAVRGALAAYPTGAASMPNGVVSNPKIFVSIGNDGIVSIVEEPRRWGQRHFTLHRGTRDTSRLGPEEAAVLKYAFTHKDREEDSVPLDKARGRIARRIRAFKEAVHSELRRLGLLFIDAGRRDEYGMHWGARALHRELERLGVPHVYEEHDGAHQGIEHRFERSLAVLGGHWGAPCAA